MKIDRFSVLLTNGKLAHIRFSLCSAFIRTNELAKEVVATNCDITVGGSVSSGAAACSPSDEWNHERGLSLSLCRALSAYLPHISEASMYAYGPSSRIKDTKDFFMKLRTVKKLNMGCTKDIDLIRAAFRIWLEKNRCAATDLVTLTATEKSNPS